MEETSQPHEGEDVCVGVFVRVSQFPHGCTIAHKPLPLHVNILKTQSTRQINSSKRCFLS